MPDTAAKEELRAYKRRFKTEDKAAASQAFDSKDFQDLVRRAIGAELPDDTEMICGSHCGTHCKNHGGKDALN